jgi:hypothetical protein
LTGVVKDQSALGPPHLGTHVLRPTQIPQRPEGRTALLPSWFVPRMRHTAVTATSPRTPMQTLPVQRCEYVDPSGSSGAASAAIPGLTIVSGSRSQPRAPCWVSLMYLLYRRTLAVAAPRLRSREFKELEIVVLRHELAVLDARSPVRGWKPARLVIPEACGMPKFRPHR